MDKNSEELMKKLINELLDILRGYDFSNSKNEIYHSLEGFDKFFFYKVAMKINKNRKANNKCEKAKEYFNEVKENYMKFDLIDPDSYSPCLQIIYRVLWGESLRHCQTKYGIAGDTMNSIMSSLSKYLHIENNLWKCIEEWKNHNGKFKESLLIGFVNCYHTLGNFMPVPHGFNNKRATYGGKVKGPKDTRKDYWYITLLDIYHYYQKDEAKKTEWEWLEEYKDWIEAFGDWNNFIEQNYLQVYVTKNGNDDYSAPLSLFLSPDKFKEFSKAFNDDKDELKNMNPSTEDFLNELKKISEDELKNFFENAAYCINKRTERMIDALRKRLDELFN